MEENRSPDILVLGLGNVLLQDEGLGVRTLERLIEQYSLPDRVQTLDGGTLGIGLLPYLEGISHLLVLDAVETGDLPGTPVRIEKEALARILSPKMSVHQGGLQELLALGDLQGCLPACIVLCGLQPAAIEWGLDLSPPVANQLDGLVGLAVEQLRKWGCPLSNKKLY